MAKILVVENEQSYCDSLQIIFSGQGHEVHTALDSTQGMHEVETWSPDLVITDWMLNGRMHGGELTLLIRKNHPKIRFIVITGFLEVVDLVTKAYDCIDEVVTKPFRATAISAAVDRSLALRADQSE